MKKKYLSNKNLLKEIQISKMTYCQYDDDKYTHYDAIVADVYELDDDNKPFLVQSGLDQITPELIQTTKEKMCRSYNRILQSKRRKPMPLDDPARLTPSQIETTDLVFRYMTYDHIPLFSDGEIQVHGSSKVMKNYYAKVPFPAFKHVILLDAQDMGSCKTVLLSHWKNNKFSPDTGFIHNELGKMWMMLVKRIGSKGNFCGYTYLSDMRGEALVQLSMVGLQFDESRQDVPNPFAFYTTVIMNSFKKILNKEKKMRVIRDDIREMQGELPSFSRQLDLEAQQLLSSSIS